MSTDLAKSAAFTAEFVAHFNVKLKALADKFNLETNIIKFDDALVLQVKCLGCYVDALDMLEDVKAIHEAFLYGKTRSNYATFDLYYADMASCQAA